MKHKICVTRFLEHFEFVEVEAESEREAKILAFKMAKNEQDKLSWVEAEKPRFKAEVVRE